MSEKFLKSITFPDLSDKYVIADESLSESGAAADAKVVGDTKANIDGYYENMTVGTSEQLISTVRENDQSPYLFRTSGGSVDIGDREYVNGIVGGSLAWNQLVNESDIEEKTAIGLTSSVTNHVYKLVNTSTGTGSFQINQHMPLVGGHKYLFTGFYKISGISLRLWNDTAGTKIAEVSPFEKILQITESADYSLYFLETNTGVAVDVECIPQVFDLTQMFGSTIADYIYALEQANAGAGVAWFKKLFPKPYYAYNAGTLKHVEGLVSHGMNGFNQWDEEWVNGYYAQGNFSADANYVAGKNKIRVLENTTYFFRAPNEQAVGFYLSFYDADGNFISSNPSYDQFGRVYVNKNQTYTIPNGVSFITFFMHANYGTTYKNDICINISWDGSRDGEYEPYELHSYPLDSDLTLRGIPKLDANNKLYYDGDTYESDGTVTRKYGIVDLGTKDWTYNSTYSVFWTRCTDGILPARSQGYDSARCSKYLVKVTDQSGATNLPDKSMMYASSFASTSICAVVVRDSAYTDATAFTTAMSGVYLVYELGTPTTETADPYVSPQIVNDFGTEEYVLDDSAFPVPVGHDTDYPLNLVAKLEMAPNSPEGNGDYIVRQVNGENSYVPLVIEDALPTMPSTAGTYKLTVTVADGSDPVLSWEAE